MRRLSRRQKDNRKKIEKIIYTNNEEAIKVLKATSADYGVEFIFSNNDFLKKIAITEQIFDV